MQSGVELGNVKLSMNPFGAGPIYICYLVSSVQSLSIHLPPHVQIRSDNMH